METVGAVSHYLPRESALITNLEDLESEAIGVNAVSDLSK